MKCTAKTSAGNPCRNPAIRGGVVCAKHGGSAPQVRAKADVRAELMQWGLGDATDDPGELLLRLLTQSRMRAEGYAAELERFVAGKPDLERAIIGDSYGEFGKNGEYVRGLVHLEAQERDRAADFAMKAIKAGLAERQVRLAERQGMLLAALLSRILDDTTLGLSAEQRKAFPGAIRAALALEAGGVRSVRG